MSVTLINGSSRREPLYTLPEIADRLGVDYSNLRVCMHTSKAKGYPKSPRPVMRVGSRSSSRMSAYMYSLSDFKRWMRDLKEFNAKRMINRLILDRNVGGDDATPR